MRITVILLTAACLTASATGLSQQKVTMNLKDVPVLTVFREINRQTGLSIIYNQKLFKDRDNITINVTQVPVEQVIEICVKGLPVEYSLEGNKIIIKEKKEEKKATSPPIDLHGRVTDTKGNPLEGATVKVKGTNIGTSTNSNGEFQLNGVSDNAILEISFVGYETYTVDVNKKSEIVAALKVSVSPLDETQVIAYGTNSRRFQTGNVSVVKAEDIAKQPVNNPLLALQGRVPGLFITQATGLPGSGVQVTIQGKNSIGNGNDPFYVIDGVPFTSQVLPNYGAILGNSVVGSGISGNPLTYLNPADIESISILKDADATAIYGSRGANGVILITTKKGKAGQTKVDVNMQTGWGRVTRKMDLLNTQQYLQMRREAKNNDNEPIYSNDYDINGFWDTTNYTDWQRELIGNTAHFNDVQASVSGGNANTQVLAGVGYHKETTVFPGDLSDQKASLHFSLNNISTNQKFRFQLTGNYLEDNNRIISRDLTQDAITLSPNAPKIYSEDGSLNWMPDETGTSTWDNPVAYLYNRYKSKTKNLVGNAIVEYQIIPGLNVKSSFGYTNFLANDLATFPLLSSRPEYRMITNRSALYSNSNLSSWIIEPQISYKTALRNGQIEALMGTTIQQNSTNGLQIGGLGYNSDIVLEDIKSAATVFVDGTTNSLYKYRALFTRISYNLLDKYLINLTARRDGSSRFGPGNQFHNFSVVGLAWIFSKENFIQHAPPFVSFGKVSVSYGTTGNDQIGDYQFMTTYRPPSSNVGVPYQGLRGLQPNILSNPFLQWEETKKLHAGLDLGLFKDRIAISAGYFRNRSGNQLLVYLLPIQTGFNNIARNLPATVQNSGLEFTLNSTNIGTKNFSWSSSFNVTIPKNELLKFPGLESSAYAASYSIGEPISRTRLYHFAGVDPTVGTYQFLDHKGNVTSYPNYSTDRTVFVNTSPLLYAGVINAFRFSRFEMSFIFQYIKRKGVNYSLGNINGAIFNVNQPVSILDRWQRPGDSRSVQRYSSNGSLIGQSSDAIESSDAVYADASFARLKNISLSWNVPQTWFERAKLRNVRLYVQGQNILTITNYVGLDPETLSSTTLPPLRVITVGLQVGF